MKQRYCTGSSTCSRELCYHLVSFIYFTVKPWHSPQGFQRDHDVDFQQLWHKHMKYIWILGNMKSKTKNGNSFFFWVGYYLKLSTSILFSLYPVFPSYWAHNMFALCIFCSVSSVKLAQVVLHRLSLHNYLIVSCCSVHHCIISPYRALILLEMSHRGRGSWTFNERSCAFSSNCHDNRSPVFTRSRSWPLSSYRVNMG